MRNAKSYKPLLFLLLTGWCLLFLRCESTEKSMVRAVYLEQSEQGYQAGLLYQAPQAAADAADATAALQFVQAEGQTMERALDAGYEPISILVEKKHVEGEAKQIIKRCGQIPVYTAEFDVLTKITGFKLTRGMLCAMHRRKLPSMREICENAKRIAVLEEVVRVFSHTTSNRIHRIQCACAEFGQCFLIDQRSEVFVFQHFDLLDFVRSAEAVEEVHERNT